MWSYLRVECTDTVAYWHADVVALRLAGATRAGLLSGGGSAAELGARDDGAQRLSAYPWAGRARAAGSEPLEGQREVPAAKEVQRERRHPPPLFWPPPTSARCYCYFEIIKRCIVSQGWGRLHKPDYDYDYSAHEIVD